MKDNGRYTKVIDRSNYCLKYGLFEVERGGEGRVGRRKVGPSSRGSSLIQAPREKGSEPRARTCPPGARNRRPAPPRASRAGTTRRPPPIQCAPVAWVSPWRIAAALYRIWEEGQI